MSNKEQSFQQNYSEFRAGAEEYKRRYSLYRSESSELNRTGIKVYESCVEQYLQAYLSGNRVHVEVTPSQGLQNFDVILQSGLSANDTIQGIQPESVECRFAGEKVESGFSMPLRKLPLSCSKPTTESVSFRITTSLDTSNIVTVPAQKSRIGELEERLEFLQAQVNAMSSTLTSYQTDTSSKIGEVEANFQQGLRQTKDELVATDNSIQASVNDINGFRGRLNVKTLHVMRGEHHRYAHPNWVHVGCGDLNGWVNAQCAGMTIQQTQVHIRSGDRCGYAYVVATCVQK